MISYIFSNLFSRQVIVFGCCLCLLSACSLFSSSDTARAPSPLIEFKATQTIRQTWTAHIGRGSGLGFVPAVVDQSVYAATPDGTVGKFDLSNGQVIWKTSTPTALSAGVGSDGKTTVVASPKGKLIAFDDNGKIKWQSQATSEVIVPPVVAAGVVVVRSADYRIQAFDADTGDQIWSFQRPGPALALKISAQMVVAEGLAITGLPGGKLLAMDLTSGNVHWEGTVATARGAGDLERLTDVVGKPELRGRLICAVTYQGRLVCFDASEGGRPTWAKDFSSVSGLASNDQFVWSSDQHSVVHSFALQNGKLMWKQEALRNRQLTAPALFSGNVLVGDLEGYVHVLGAETGQLTARLALGGGAIVSPPQTTTQGVLLQTGKGDLVILSGDQSG